MAVALAFFVVFWLVYDGICRLFGRGRHGDVVVGALVAVFIAAASWLACHWFAYTHPQNWLVLLLIMLGGAAVRQFFVVRHRFSWATPAIRWAMRCWASPCWA